ncbi:MAG: Glu-tRNA(Gln) amidotransferase GatDE subunit E [Ectothiorhodospiraceae bacterium]|nr:Glu-tRNA(Gln) amidotransferase GatDE subunit E [Ectothiorhodospiraceae bacterium]
MYDFRFKPFEEMTPEDYAEVGFMSGLEVHQQLLTKRKLFCRCPAGKFSTEYHAEILRHMRPTLSELGEYDGTALMEFKTKKNIIYRINKETVCTYEMDDTPPFMIDDEALDYALEISLQAGLSLVDELHIARKQYLDGSIPTGFQRTTICGVNGSVPYKDREIGIIQLGLEEDSCREISDVGHNRIYNTDRLGMPLIELVTQPDMKHPQEVMEVANVLRKMMRTTQHVRRGAGATRADTNVSVRGGTRIEIKGVPSTNLMPLLTYNEAMRQYNLLRLREELKSRGITEQTFTYDSMVATKLLRRTRFTPINDAIANGHRAMVVKLPGWADLLRWETQTETLFSREISDRVRVIACLTTLPNIIHSDSPSESISGAEWQQIKKAMNATPDDTVVVVWGSQIDTETAVNEIAIRAREATIGIPSETRQALRDGTTGFERILPGPERMYPDTDLPPIKISPERLQRITSGLPEPHWDIVRRLKKLGIPEDCIEGLAISPLVKLVDEAINEMKLSPSLVGEALWRYPRYLQRKGYDKALFDIESIRAILKSVADGNLTPDGIIDQLRKLKDGPFDPASLPPRMKAEELKPVIESALDAVRSNGFIDKANIPNLTLDKVMDEVRGRIPGAEVAKYVESNVPQEG